MADVIGDLIVQIRGDDSELQKNLNEAASLAKAAGDKIAKALDLNKLGAHFEQLGSRMASVGQSMSIAFTAPLAAAGLAALKVAGQLEQAEVGFKTLLGSAERAGQHLGELKKFAASTPFEFLELVNASKRLQALGFTAKEIIPTLTAVGNTASALGSGALGIERITLALGQMRAKGKVSAEEMRQLAEAGLPAWQILADAISKTEKRVVTVAEVMKKAEAGFIDGNMAAAALVAGMQAKFGGLMEAQAKTLLGVFSNFKDKLTFLMGDIGTSLAPIAKRILDSLQGVIEVVGRLAKQFAELPPGIQTAAIAFTGLVAAAGPVLFVAGQLISSFGTVLRLLGTLAPAATAAGASIGAAGLAGAMAVLGVAAVAVVGAIAAWNIGKFASDVGQFIGETTRAGDSVNAFVLKLRAALPELEKFRTAFQITTTVNPFRIVSDELGMGGFKNEFAGLTTTIAKELKGLRPAFKDAQDDVTEYAQQMASARRVSEELAKALSEKVAHAFTTLGLKNLALEARQAVAAFDLLKGKLSDTAKIDAAYKVFDLLNRAFSDGAISAVTFTTETERLGSIMDAAIQRVDAARSSLKQFGDSFNNDPMRLGAELMKAYGLAALEANVNQLLFEQGLKQVNAELAKLGTQTGLPSVTAVLKELREAFKEVKNPQDLLRSVGVRRTEDLENILANNETIQQSNQYTQEQKIKANEAATRAIVNNERTIRDELANQLQAEIQLKAFRGESATVQIIALEKIRLAQEIITEQSQRMGKLYVELLGGVRHSFAMVGRSIADNIVEWKHWGDVIENVGKNIAKMFLDIVVGTAMNALALKLIELTGLAEPLAKMMAKIGLGTVGGIAGQEEIAAKIAAEAAGLGGAATKATGDAPVPKTPGSAGPGSFSGAMSLVEAGIAAAAGITAGIQASRMINLLSGIELSTRATKEQITGGTQTALNTWLPKLDYLKDIWVAIVEGISKTNAILSTGNRPLITQAETDEILKYLKLLTMPLAAGGELAPVGGLSLDGEGAADSVKKLSRGFDVLAEAGRDLRQVSTDIADWRQWQFPLPTPTGIDPAGLLVTSMQDMARWRALILSMGIIPEIVSSVTGRVKGSEVSEAERAAAILAARSRTPEPVQTTQQMYDKALATLNSQNAQSIADQIRAIPQYAGFSQERINELAQKAGKQAGTSGRDTAIFQALLADPRNRDKAPLTDAQVQAFVEAQLAPFRKAAGDLKLAVDYERAAVDASLKNQEQFARNLTLQSQVNSLQQVFYEANSGTALYDLARKIGSAAALQATYNASALLTEQVRQLQIQNPASTFGLQAGGALVELPADLITNLQQFNTASYAAGRGLAEFAISTTFSNEALIAAGNKLYNAAGAYIDLTTIRKTSGEPVSAAEYAAAVLEFTKLGYGLKGQGQAYNDFIHFFDKYKPEGGWPPSPLAPPNFTGDFPILPTPGLGITELLRSLPPFPGLGNFFPPGGSITIYGPGPNGPGTGPIIPGGLGDYLREVGSQGGNSLPGPSGQVTVYNMDLGSTRLANSITEGLWANGFRMR